MDKLFEVTGEGHEVVVSDGTGKYNLHILKKVKGVKGMTHPVHPLHPYQPFITFDKPILSLNIIITARKPSLT